MSLLEFHANYPPIVHAQRAYNWEVLFPDIRGIPFIGNIEGYAVSKFCQNASFGQYNIGQTTEVKEGVEQAFFADLLSLETASFTFICPVPDNVMFYFTSWKSLIVDKRGHYSPANKYKKTITVILYDRSGLPSNFIRLEKAFPIKYPAYSLTYAGEELVRYDVDVKFDKISMGTTAVASAVGGIIEGVNSGVQAITDVVF